MTHNKLSANLFVYCFIFAQIDWIVFASDEKCDRVFQKDAKNVSNFIESNTSVSSNNLVLETMDSLTLKYDSNYESCK